MVSLPDGHSASSSRRHVIRRLLKKKKIVYFLSIVYLFLLAQKCCIVFAILLRVIELSIVVFKSIQYCRVECRDVARVWTTLASLAETLETNCLFG